FYRYIRAYGFGQPTGIDFPGEASGFVAAPGQIKHGELLRWANIGCGQGIAVTPIQMVRAAAAIANRGVLMKPQLVREIREPDGTLIWAHEPEPVRQGISRATAAPFLGSLRGVGVDGSGAPGASQG